MSYALGKRSRDNLNGVHPFLVSVAETAITLTKQDFTVFDGVRTVRQQRALVSRGASKTMDSKHLPQEDGFGHAIDLVPIINGQPRWEWTPIFFVAAAVQQAVATVNERRLAAGLDSKRLRWGGVWDMSFEVLGRSPAQLEKAVDDYVQRRRAAGKRAFIDGPHWEIVG